MRIQSRCACTLTHIPLLRWPLSIHNYNIDSVLRAYLHSATKWSAQMSHRVTIRSSIALATKQVTGQLETKHFSGQCLSPEAVYVCVCVCVCVRGAAAVFSLILRHIVWYSQQRSTFYPPYSLALLPTHSTAVEEPRRGICCLLVLSGSNSPPGSDVTTRRPTEASR